MHPLVVVERHVQTEVLSFVLEQRPTANHPQTGQRNVINVAGHYQHVAAHFANVLQERQVVARVEQEHEFEVAVDVCTVGVACTVLVVVALTVPQTEACATTYCKYADTYSLSKSCRRLGLVDWSALSTQLSAIIRRQHSYRAFKNTVWLKGY